jgi:arylsulfatase A-like enzyme
MSNVVLISIDCLRPEALSCYEDEFDKIKIAPYSAKTPNIDDIADDGIRFTNAFTQAPFTPASHASVFTGTNPYRHGIRSMFNCDLNDDLNTIAEIYRGSGHETGAFIGAHALSEYYGLNRGFDTYDDEFDTARENSIIGNRRPGSEVTTKAIDWIDQSEDDIFLFLHYFDAHSGPGAVIDGESEAHNENTPLHVRFYDRFLKNFDDLFGSKIKDSYNIVRRLRGEVPDDRSYHIHQVKNIDSYIGKIKEALEDDGVYDETTIVLFGDHGDAFGEHGEYGHRRYLYDTTLRVPLIIKPGAGSAFDGFVNDDVVRLIDIYTTLLMESDFRDTQSDGTDLIEYAKNNQDNLKAYAETRFESSLMELRNPETDYMSLRTSEWKLIVDQLDGSEELYNVASDSQELNDVSTSQSAVVEDMKRELEAMIEDFPDKLSDIDSSKASPAVIDQLEGLGYL